MFKVGRVIVFYETTGVALIELEGTIAVHDKVRFLFNHDYLFSQVIESIQVGHTKVDAAGRGDVVGVKTNEKVLKGTDIFKES